MRRLRVVVLNSASGTYATANQRAALKRWIERGGVVAIHAAGDNSHAWPWWVDEVIGARFTGHPGGDDHFQPANLIVVTPDQPVMAGLNMPWRPIDEWYAFDRVPAGATILATIDEGSYRPEATKRMGLHAVV